MAELTFAEKVAFYNKVKLRNFRASCALEGIVIPSLEINPEETLKAIKEKYERFVRSV